MATIKSLKTFTGTFVGHAYAPATQVSITGVGFQPKAVLFFGSGEDNPTSIHQAGDHARFFGYAVSSSDRACAASSSQDAVTGGAVTYRSQSAVACVTILNPGAATINGQYDFVSMDSDGFTLIVDDTFSGSPKIGYLALGGDSLLNAAGGSLQNPSSSGNQTISGVGFEPNFVFFMTTGKNTNNNTVSVDSTMGIGVAKSASEQYTLCGGSNSGSDPSQTISYSIGGHCWSAPDSGVEGIRVGTFVEFNADGYVINWNHASADYTNFLCLEFDDPDQVALGDTTSKTDEVTPIVATGLGIQPAGVFFASHCQAISTIQYPDDDDKWSVGACHTPGDSSTNAIAMSTHDMDNSLVGTPDETSVFVGIQYGAVYDHTTYGGGALHGTMSVQSFDTDGFTCIMDDDDYLEAFIWFVAFGNSPRHPYCYMGHLFMLSPDVVFKAQVDVATINSGKVASTSIFKHIYPKTITTGAVADIKEGMTITIGSAAEGDDKGRARVRGTSAVGEDDVIEVWASPNVHDGELDLATDLYITVWDDYRVWMKPPYAAAGVYTYDGDRGPQYVTYDNLPIANGGPGYAGFIDSVSELITVDFDGAASFAESRTSVLGAYSADRCTGGSAAASTTTGANAAANAFDDNTGTYWESAGISAFDETITYTFAASVLIRRVGITASTTYAPKGFDILINVAGTDLTILRPPDQTAWGASETRYFYPDHPIAATDVRIKIDTGNGEANIRIEEIIVSEEDRTGGTAYTWDVDDGSITVGDANTEAITATFPAGFRWVHLTVTDTDSNTGICHIPVFAATTATVIDDFEVTSQELTSGGQTIGFRVFEAIPEATYPDGTLVMYWEEENYNSILGSQADAGPDDRQHMKFIGWVNEEPARVTANKFSTNQTTELRCVDVGGRLRLLPGFSTVAVRYTETAPDNCFKMDYANMDHLIYVLLRWFSTATEVADYTPSNTYETFNFFEIQTDGGNLFDVVDGRAQAMAHRLTCNKVGQLKVLPDPQLQDSGDRTAEVQATLTTDDYRGIDYTQTRPSRFHWLWGSGLSVSWLGFDQYASTFYSTFFCVAPGEAPGQGLGSRDQGEQLVSGQTELNTREGHRYALRLNAPQGYFTVQLVHSGDAGIDPAEMEWVSLTLDADYAAQRGLTFSAERFLPYRVSIRHLHDRQTKVVTLELEREREGRAAITYTPPV